MTKAELDRWTRAKMREIDRNVRLDRVRRRVQKIDEMERQIRRKTEQLTIAVAKTRATLSRGSIDDRMRRQRIVTADIVRPGTEAQVERWRQDAANTERANGWTVTEVMNGNVNAYAWTGLKRIESSPINNAETYASRKHEQGHCANPCRSTHRRVSAGPDTRRTVCVECELIAWRWAQDHAVDWTREMHGVLATSLRSYRKFGTAAEQAAIDHMVSGLGFCEVRQRRARRTA